VSKTAKTILILSALSLLVLTGFVVRSSWLEAYSDHNSQQLIIFHAGSLSVPFKQISEEFNMRHPDVKIIREAKPRTCTEPAISLLPPIIRS
jgi:molybdate/tungstate transport system substrate-binding protein